MSELEKIARYIELTGHEKVINKARYGMDIQEYMELVHMAGEKPFEAVQLVFDYGFAKGFRTGKVVAAKRVDKGENMVIYPNINAERARKGMSMEELAAVLGVTRKTFYNWISRGNIPQNKLEQMARLFSCSVEYLLERDENEIDTQMQQEGGGQDDGAGEKRA